MRRLNYSPPAKYYVEHILLAWFHVSQKRLRTVGRFVDIRRNDERRAEYFGTNQVVDAARRDARILCGRSDCCVERLKLDSLRIGGTSRRRSLSNSGNHPPGDSFQGQLQARL